MRAVGFSRAKVFTVFVSEALGLGVLSGALAYVLGQLLTGYVLRQLHLAEDLSLAFQGAAFMLLVLLAALTAAVAAAFPAWKASLVEPAEALVSV
jgi:putative ABC transport system permease protein